MSVVYFLQIENDGPIKIGITTGVVAERVIDLQIGCPWRIDVLGYVAGDAAHENWLHQKFASIQMLGEWFSPTQELKDEIRKILSADFTWPFVLSEVSAIQRAVRIAGSEAKLAAGIGCSQVAINKAKRRDRVSAEMALAIHRFLKGTISAADLRPDIWTTQDAAHSAASQVLA